MRWLLAALGLTAVVVGAAAWIGLRDWQSEGALAGQRVTAKHHAGQMLAAMVGDRPCAYCRVDVVGPLREHVWRVTVQSPRRLTCFDIDNDRFAMVPGRGIVGVRAATCPTT